MAKRAKIDKITNRFMINLVWGIVIIMFLLYMQNTLVWNWGVMKVPAITFLVLAVGFFACGWFKVIKNKTRAYDYAIFMVALAICSFIIAYFPVFDSAFEKLFNTSIDSRLWTNWGPIAVTLAYLAFSFIWTVVSIAIIERKK